MDGLLGTRHEIFYMKEAWIKIRRYGTQVDNANMLD